MTVNHDTVETTFTGGVSGVGNFGTRPVSRDSRVRTASNHTPQNNNNAGNNTRIQQFLRASGQTAEMLKISDLVTNASQETRYQQMA